MKKLHIGTGGNYLSNRVHNPSKRIMEGWLETDVEPRAQHVVEMDATKEFPYDDASFDYVFSEHMIEHIVYDDGLKMLAECYRVLVPGGKVRISTPDLQFLIGMCSDGRTEEMSKYLEFQHKHNPKEMQRPTACFLINFFVRMGGEHGGHIFIYDEESLSYAMRSVGFKNIERFKIMESNDEHLRGLEAQFRLPPGMLQLETFTLEGTK